MTTGSLIRLDSGAEILVTERTDPADLARERYGFLLHLSSQFEIDLPTLGSLATWGAALELPSLDVLVLLDHLERFGFDPFVYQAMVALLGGTIEGG